MAWRAADASATVRHNQLHRSRQTGADPDRVSALARAAEDADQKLADIECDLARRSPLLLQPSGLRDQPGLAGRIAAALPADTVLVAYRLHEDTLLVWAITNRGLVIAEQRALDKNVLIERIRLLRDACAQLASDWAEHAAMLSSTLLDPLAPVLRDHQRLLVVPAGPLHHLPLAVLPWNGQPVVASHQVSYLPTASVAATALGYHDPRAEVIAFGDPTGMRWPTGSPAQALPDARWEARQVATTSGGTAQVGSAATKQAVLAALSQRKVVYLASHGYFDADARLPE